MPSLTVDEIKSALVAHSVELPSSKARKSVYLQLYRDHIAPLNNSTSEFSSDDESLPELSLKLSPDKKSQNMADISPNDVQSLNDDDLFDKLTELGVTVGPIVDSTRRIYQKKLITLLGGDVVNSPYSGEEVDLDEYSADEEEPKKEVATTTTYSKKESTTTSSPRLRQRLLEDATTNYSSLESRSPASAAEFHTPSPRPSLRSVTSSSSSVTTRRFTTPGGSSYLKSNQGDESCEVGSCSRSIFKFLVKIVMLLLFLSIIFFLYQYYNKENPLEGLEHLARQALDAYESKQQNSDSGTNSKPTPSPKVKSS